MRAKLAFCAADAAQQKQAEVDALQKRVAAAGTRQRGPLEQQLAETRSELALAQARAQALKTMADFSAQVGSGSAGLLGQIDELERSVPEVRAPPAATGAATPAPRRAGQGVLGLLEELFAISRKQREISASLRETAALRAASEKLRAPLGAGLKSTLQQGDQLSSAPDSADPAVIADRKKRLDDLTSQFKKVSAALLPLEREEARPVAQVRKVTRAFEYLQSAAGHGEVCNLRVTGRDHRIARAPHEQRRNVACQVAAIEHGDRLPAPVDGGAQRWHESAPGPRVGQGVKHGQQILGVAPSVGSQQLEQLENASAGHARTWELQEWKNQVGIGGRGEAQERMDLGVDTAGADEHKAFTTLGVLIGELHRHPPTERVSDHGGAFHANHAQEVAHRVCVCGHRVIRARLVRAAVAEQIGRDDGVLLRKWRDQFGPGVRAIADAVDQLLARRASGSAFDSCVSCSASRRGNRRWDSPLLRGGGTAHGVPAASTLEGTCSWLL